MTSTIKSLLWSGCVLSTLFHSLPIITALSPISGGHASLMTPFI